MEKNKNESRRDSNAICRFLSLKEIEDSKVFIINPKNIRISSEIQLKGQVTSISLKGS